MELMWKVVITPYGELMIANFENNFEICKNNPPNIEYNIPFSGE